MLSEVETIMITGLLGYYQPFKVDHNIPFELSKHMWAYPFSRSVGGKTPKKCISF